MFSKVVVKNQSATHSSRVGVRLLITGIAILTLCQSVGCSGSLREINEAAMLSYRDHVWSKRAYNLRYANCDRQYAQHFQSGFQAGYVAMCTGGDGYVPALPPQEYRAYEFQSVDGAKCVNSWFEGYPAGVAAAKHDKAGTYHDVLISRLINSAIEQEKTVAVLPGDVPITTADQALPATANIQNNVQASFQPPVQTFQQPRTNQVSVLAQQPMPRQMPQQMPQPMPQHMAPRTSMMPPVLRPSPMQVGANQVSAAKSMDAQRYTPPPTATLPPIMRPEFEQSVGNTYRMGSNQVSISAPMNERQYQPQSKVLPPIVRPSSGPMAQTAPIMQVSTGSAEAAAASSSERQIPAMKEYSIMRSNEPLPMAQAPEDWDSTRRVR